MNTSIHFVKNSIFLRRSPLLLCLVFLLTACSNDETSSGEVPPPILTNPVDGKAVLFVGNSLTNNNSMAEMVRRMAASTERALLYTQHAPGGEQISEHATSSELEGKIRSQNWDFVSIQVQSVAMALDDSFVENTIFPDVLTVVDKVRANHGPSIPLFYMTWGLENGDESLCAPLPDVCTFEGMNTALKERHLTLMERADGQVSPCAELWRVLREQHPDFDLYAEDGLHPSILGSYVVALSFYTMIFKADPTEITYHRTELDVADEQLAREIVKEVVFDCLSEWQAN